MATRTFASLVTRVNPSTPGCPHPTILKFIRDSAIRVCERTLAWRYMEPVFLLEPGVHEYGFNRPDGTDVHAIFGAFVNGQRLEPLPLDDALSIYPQWAELYNGVAVQDVWSQTTAHTYNTDLYDGAPLNAYDGFTPPDGVFGSDEPRSITQISPARYIVLPQPGADRPLQMRLFYALKPQRNADGMDGDLLDELEDVIVHGALQHLLTLPNQGWSDRELAAYHAKQYLSQITERRARANLGNARGTLRVKHVPFA